MTRTIASCCSGMTMRRPTGGTCSGRDARRAYPDVVERLEACLIDAYDTILTCDYSEHRRVLPRLAGVPADTMFAEFAQLLPALTDGRLSMTEAFGQILLAGGVEPQPDLVHQVVDKSRELLVTTARFYDDVIPFLQNLRSHGIKVAIVSNCDEHMRDLLAERGVAALADALVLSCEVRAVKPVAQIFQRALDQLGVRAGAALFVDDNASCCAGAAALGLRAVQMVRGEIDGHGPAAGTTVVQSLPEVEVMLGL